MGIKCVEVTIGKFSPLDIWYVKKLMIVEGTIKYIKDLVRYYICACGKGNVHPSLCDHK
jgi:hypothetical protein